MLKLKEDSLEFSFPEIHPGARLRIDFQRTLRIPDDGNAYPLPPGLGRFPLRQVDDHAPSVPRSWLKQGGVMLPMYQSEALWLNFTSSYLGEHGTEYPFAVRIATGRIDAVSGEAWKTGLRKHPQNYVVVPEQPWLDGYCVGTGRIRQFVATPLGSGYSAEGQITGTAEHGGIQIQVYPMKRSVFERLFPKRSFTRHSRFDHDGPEQVMACSPGMGLAPGGTMEQELYEDPFGFFDWDRSASERCVVHIANSLLWRAITGQQAPTTPFTATEYRNAGLPWFTYYNETATALAGTTKLTGLKSVKQLAEKKGETALPDNHTVDPSWIVRLKATRTADEVRVAPF